MDQRSHTGAAASIITAAGGTFANFESENIRFLNNHYIYLV